MLPSDLELLIEHMKWADAEVWKKVLNLSSAGNDDRLIKLLYHLHQVQYAFLSLWDNSPIDLPKSETFEDLKSIAKWGFEYQQKLNDFFLSQIELDKEEIVQIPWSVFMERRTGKKIIPATLKETMLQVTTHSTYHRGQINARFKELGGEPGNVDFIIWIWLGKTKVDWDNLI